MRQRLREKPELVSVIRTRSRWENPALPQRPGSYTSVIFPVTTATAQLHMRLPRWSDGAGHLCCTR
jgi:hypothetical protein